MKIVVDKHTNVVVYPNLPDKIIHIENPEEHSIVLVEVESVDALIAALQKAKEALNG